MKERPLSELLSGLAEKERQKKVWNDETRTLLRAARKQVSLTQGELAAAAGVTQSYVSQIENGDRSVSTDTLNSFSSVIAEVAEKGGISNASQVRNSAKEASRKARGK